MKVNRKLWIPAPENGNVYGRAVYLRSTGFDMLQGYGYTTKSDRGDAGYIRYSTDNGDSWGSPTEVPTVEQRGTDWHYRQTYLPFLDARRDRLVRFHVVRVLPGDNVIEGTKHIRIYYDVSIDGGKSYSEEQQIIQTGDEYDFDHWMTGVYYGDNGAQIEGGPRIAIGENEILVPMCLFPKAEGGGLYRPIEGAFTYAHNVFLIGKWQTDSLELRWDASKPVIMDPEVSTRGFNEPTCAYLSDTHAKNSGHGRLACICRGSNAGRPNLPSYKWVMTSDDEARTWCTPVRLQYDDGGELLSPSSLSQLVPHSSGALYWIANIVDTNPKGNLPRYPLVIAEIDQDSLSVIRSSLCTIDTREAGENASLCLSNFQGAYEDRKSGEIVITLPRVYIDGSEAWHSPCMIYRVTV